MNVFVVYSFDDYEIVKKHIEEVKSKVPNITFFYFMPDRNIKLWHKRASKKIKESNMVIFFDCFDNNLHAEYKNVLWELKCAEKYKKRIVVFKTNIDNDGSYASQIYSTDYSDKVPNKSRYRTKSIDELIPYLKAEANWTVENSLLKEKSTNQTELSYEDKLLLLEQYKIMIDTSEKLMERRQASTNLYTTICSALIAFIGASFGFGDTLITAVICFLSGIIAILLCNNWRNALKSYELNNTGKYAVINQIERYLPAEIFECEYKYNTLNGIRSYSSRERNLPLVFMLFGIILIIFAVTLFILRLLA